MKLSDDLVQLTSRLMLVQERKEAVSLAQELASFVEKVDSLECRDIIQTQTSISTLLKFTMKEISKVQKISKTFKKEFIANGLCAHVIKRRSGKRGFYYEIRYRRNGYNLYAASTNLTEAKEKFLKQTEVGEIEKHYIKTNKTITTFSAVALAWFEYKKGKIVSKTWTIYKSYYDRILFPEFHDVPINTIRTADLDRLFDSLDGRAYEDVRIVANSIFKYAQRCEFIDRNPVEMIPFKRAERINRPALTRQQVQTLLFAIEQPKYTKYRQDILIMLYFGLRPCELTSVRIEGDFLISINAKRKSGKVEYKKIPISDRIRDKLDFSTLTHCRSNDRNAIFQAILGSKEISQYSLRHTFATKCQEYVRPDIVDIWMGDSSERLVGRVYTHFSDEFMKEQMNKVVFDL